jgi:hypothetical protein
MNKQQFSKGQADLATVCGFLQHHAINILHQSIVRCVFANAGYRSWRLHTERLTPQELSEAPIYDLDRKTNFVL